MSWPLSTFFVCAVFRAMVETVLRLSWEVPGECAVYVWGGNSVEGNLCQRWVLLFSGFGGSGQAQGRSRLII